MKKIIILGIFIFISLFSFAQHELTAPQKYYKAFDTLKYVYTNYCCYSREELAHVIQTKVINVIEADGFMDNLKKIEGKQFEIFEHLINYMLFRLYGNINEAHNSLKKTHVILEDPERFNETTRIIYNSQIYGKERTSTSEYIKKDIEYFDEQDKKLFDNITGKALELRRIKNNIKTWNNCFLENNSYHNHKNNLEIINKNYIYLKSGYFDIKYLGGDSKIEKYQKKTNETLAIFDDKEYLIKDYAIIYQNILFFEKMFAVSPSTEEWGTEPITLPLNNMIIDYNELINSNSSKKYPILKNYELFFGNNIKDSLDLIINKYKTYNKNYKAIELKDYNYNIPPCSNCSPEIINGHGIIDTGNVDSIANKNTIEINSFEEFKKKYTKITDTTFVKDFLETVNINSENIVEVYEIRDYFNLIKPDELSAITVLNYKDKNLFIDSAFIYSKKEKIIIIKNIPENTEYENILELYDVPEEAKRVVFERLLVKNILNVTGFVQEDNEVEYGSRYQKLLKDYSSHTSYLPSTFTVYNLASLSLNVKVIKKDVAGVSSIHNNPFVIQKIEIKESQKKK